jgi:hypothetical protein
MGRRILKKRVGKRVKEHDSLVTTSSTDSRKEHFGNYHHLICKIMYNDKQNNGLCMVLPEQKQKY